LRASTVGFGFLDTSHTQKNCVVIRHSLGTVGLLVMSMISLDVQLAAAFCAIEAPVVPGLPKDFQFLVIENR
jgi:hypothetical protein